MQKGNNMCRKVKKFDYYTRCSYCKRVFCNEGYDMSRYAYTAFSMGESYISVDSTA